jgi:hypothetical protein
VHSEPLCSFATLVQLAGFTLRTIGDSRGTEAVASNTSLSPCLEVLVYPSTKRDVIMFMMCSTNELT